MTFTDAIKTCFRKYVTFSGRAARSEYWWFFLFIILGNIVAGILDGILFGTGSVAVTDTSVQAETSGPISALFGLATFLPLLAAGWRRMHDTGRSGLYVLYPAIVFVGIGLFVSLMGGFATLSGGDITGLFGSVFGIILMIALIVLLLSPLIVLWWLTRPSQPGSNEWGPNPHGPASEGGI